MLKVSKLTVSLLPVAYKDASISRRVDPATWEKLRHRALAAAGNQCECCQSREVLKCTEVWDVRDATHLQTLKGLRILCNACYEATHIDRAEELGREAQARQQLITVNDWTVAKLDAYLEKEWALWYKRSRQAWALDLKWLADNR